MTRSSHRVEMQFRFAEKVRLTRFGQAPCSRTVKEKVHDAIMEHNTRECENRRAKVA